MRESLIKRLDLATTRRSELIDVTAAVSKVVSQAKIDEGICHVYVPHTTAAVTINESADPNVVIDIVNHLEKLVPRSPLYRHTEGNADAHLKSSLVGCSVSLMINNGTLILGTWQGIFFCEFDGPRHRQFYVQILS
jgi:secondary thiamine-phosphate synthase enzyme